MKLVILTARGPEHRWVTQTLADAFPDELKAIVVADSPARPLRARIRTYVRRYTVSQLASRIVARVADRMIGGSAARSRTISERLRTRSGDQLPRAELVRVVPGHNHAQCIALLDAIAPDVIAVYGTGVIKEGVIARAGVVILNLHTGISPRYRGSDSVFWAIHNSEPEWVGATVHALSLKLDAGPIYRTVAVEVEKRDDEGVLFAKAVAAGADAYVEVIREVAAGRATPQPQNLADGREYRFVDRTLTAEIRARRILSSRRDG